MIPVEVIESFWRKVKKTKSCWLWTASHNGRGYGVIGKNDGRRWYAHRLSYEIHHGPVPAGLSVCHTCDTPGCVNPKHLWLGKHLENARDMIRKGRALHREFHPSAKLTWAEVREIRRLRGRVTQKNLACRYGVTKANIARIHLGLTWKP